MVKSACCFDGGLIYTLTIWNYTLPAIQCFTVLHVLLDNVMISNHYKSNIVILVFYVCTDTHIITEGGQHCYGSCDCINRDTVSSTPCFCLNATVFPRELASHFQRRILATNSAAMVTKLIECGVWIRNGFWICQVLLVEVVHHYRVQSVWT